MNVEQEHKHIQLEYFPNTKYITINLYSAFQRAQKKRGSHTSSFILELTERKGQVYIITCESGHLRQRDIKKWARKTEWQEPENPKKTKYII